MPSQETKSGLTTSNEALESDEAASEKQSKDQRKNSVYDFLYHDARRVGSFLSQFETYGVLQGVKATESVAQVAARKTAASGGFNVPLAAQAQAGFDRTITDEERDSAERTYDPLWTNARTLLDFLDAESLIERDLSKARIGQFVLVSGQLSITDLAISKKLLQMPATKDITKKASAVIIKQNIAKGIVSPVPPDFILQLIDKLPHSIHGVVKSTSSSVWCTLNERFLVTSSSDLLLKHGIDIEWTWSMLGILDAMPSSVMPTIKPIALNPSVPQHLSVVVESVAPLVRIILGRPLADYGMTPLMIFREVSA